MTTATISSFSSGAESQIGGRMKQTSSSSNPVYVSAVVTNDNDPLSSSLYEELPQAHVKQEHIQTNNQPPLPPFSSSFQTGRVTNNNVLYASSGGSTHTLVKSSTHVSQVYQYDRPPDIDYIDKQSGCVFTCEAAILVMGLLVILLAGAALTMSLLLWFQVISVQTAVVSTTAPTTPVPGECPCRTVLAQRGNYMTLLNNVQNVQIELETLMNETTQNTAQLQNRYDELFNQLENSKNVIESDVSRPVPSTSSSTASFESLQECVDGTQDVCSINVGSCSGGFAPIVNSGLEVLTEFSCYLQSDEDHGPVNGSALIQAAPSPQLGSYTVQQLNNVVSCFCFLFEEYPVHVKCMRKFVRCPSKAANFPISFTI